MNHMASIGHEMGMGFNSSVRASEEAAFEQEDDGSLPIHFAAYHSNL